MLEKRNSILSEQKEIYTKLSAKTGNNLALFDLKPTGSPAGLNRIDDT